MAKNSRFWLVIIIVLAFLLRIYNLGQSFWLDETAQAVMSSQPLSYIWSGRQSDFHPPLFYFLSHYFIQVSRAETFLRLLPLSFGLLNIWLLYYFSRSLFPRQPYAGLLAAFLLSINPYHIYYSQEFRSYSLLCLLGTLSMYLFYKKKASWLAIANALLLYTHYASVYLIASQFAFWLFTYRKHFPKYWLSLTGSLLLYLPWLPQLFSQLHSGTNIESFFPGWSNMLSVAPLKILPMAVFKLVAGRISFLNRYVYGAYIVSVLAIFFSGILLAYSSRRFLYTWLFLPIFIMMAISLFLPQNQPFRVIYILPAIILLLVQTCFRFPKLFITFLLYISLVGNISYFTRPRLQREQWRQAISYVQSKSAPTLVAFTSVWAPFSWYGPGMPVLPAFSKLPPEYPSTLNNLRQLGSSRQVFVFDYLSAVSDPQDVLGQALLGSGYKQTLVHNYEGVGFIKEYEKQD